MQKSYKKSNPSISRAHWFASSPTMARDISWRSGGHVSAGGQFIYDRIARCICIMLLYFLKWDQQTGETIRYMPLPWSTKSRHSLVAWGCVHLQKKSSKSRNHNMPLTQLWQTGPEPGSPIFLSPIQSPEYLRHVGVAREGPFSTDSLNVAHCSLFCHDVGWGWSVCTR